MGKWCLNCGKVLKNQKATHCSDECLLANLKDSKSKSNDGQGAEYWSEGSDPWK